MFSDNKNRTQENSSIQNLIAKGTKIIGTFSSGGDIRIDGIIEGDVITSGKVVIGKSGQVNGTLESNNAYVEGKLKGEIKLTGMLTLKSTAEIEGEVTIEKLAVEPGAIFNVTCVMKSSVKDIKGDKKGKKIA